MEQANRNQNGYVTTSSSDITETIVSDQTKLARFINTKNADPAPIRGNLTVSKTVSGSGANTSKAFTFTVTLKGEGASEVTGSYGSMEFSGGEETFTLKYGEQKTADDLPAGLTYEVVERDNTGYAVSSTGNTGTIVAGDLKAAPFINRRSSGGGDGNSDDGSSDGDDTTSLTVKKVWNLDDGCSHPSLVKVVRLRDGKPYGRLVTLDSGNN